MQIQIYSQDIELSDPFRTFIEEKIQETLSHVAERLTRVEVHLKDMNSQKNGRDKRCLIEARPRGMEPVAVEHDADSPRDAVQHAAQKLGRALQHRFDKRSDAPRRRAPGE
jgi:ribosomal subunit interface protein